MLMGFIYLAEMVSIFIFDIWLVHCTKQMVEEKFWTHDVYGRRCRRRSRGGTMK